MSPITTLRAPKWRYFLTRKETAVFLFAASVRLAVFLFLCWWFLGLGRMHDPTALFPYPVLGGDSGDYATLTENLWKYGTFSSSLTEPLIPESFRLPGYPFFLYLFQFLPFPFVLAVLFQILLAGASAVLVYLLGKKFLSERTGFLGALLFGIEPTSVLFSTTIMSDAVFVFALLLGTYLLLREPKNGREALATGLLAGIVFGYAVLVRVIAQYLAYCLALAYLFIFKKHPFPWRTTAIKLSAFLIGAFLVTLPWSLRNHAVFNTYTLSSTPYINFTQYNLVYFYAHQHGVSKEEAQRVYSDPIPYGWDSLWFRSLVNESIFKQEMAEGLRGNIIPYAQFHLVKTLPFFVNDGLRDINRMVGFLPQPHVQTNFTDLLLQKDFRAIWNYVTSPSPALVMLVLGAVIWISITLLWIGGLLHALVTRRKGFWFMVCASGIIVYFAVLSSPVIQPRYRMPAAPFILLLAADSALLLSLTIRRKMRQIQ